MLRAIVVPELYDNGAPTACAYIRLILPLTQKQVASALDIRFVPLKHLSAIRGDIVIVQRLSARTQAEVIQIIEYCRRYGTKLVYDIDDDLLALGEDHPESENYKEYGPLVKEMLNAADQVWVSTEILAERYHSIAKQIFVVPNRLDARVWRGRPEEARRKGPTRFLYAGTSSHQPDYERIIAPSFSLLEREFGSDVELHLVGLAKQPGSRRTIEIPIPAGVPGSYPAFATWLQSLDDFDIGLAPLLDTPFNEAKSNIKWWEYSAIGLASILADLAPYHADLEGGESALLVKPTPKGFYGAMRDLLIDRERRTALRAAAMDRVKRSLATHIERDSRLDLLEHLY